MATNKVYKGETLYLVTSASAVSGDPMVIGSYLPCVLLTDADTDNSNKATVAPEGVWKLSVEAKDDSGSNAVSAGDAIYYNSTDDPVLTKKSSGEFFGIALESIGGGSTDTINVMIRPKAGVGGVTSSMLSTAMQDKITSLSISAADQADGTTDVTVQAKDVDGNDLTENIFFRFWTGGADDYGVDAITGISATTGTLVHSHTSNGDVDIITDTAGEAVLAMDNGGAGTIYCWAEIQGRVYESGELSITSA